jgi:hypothetical protein
MSDEVPRTRSLAIIREAAREAFMAKSTQHIPGAVVFTPWPTVAFSFVHAAGVPCGCRGLLARARS